MVQAFVLAVISNRALFINFAGVQLHPTRPALTGDNSSDWQREGHPLGAFDSYSPLLGGDVLTTR